MEFDRFSLPKNAADSGLRAPARRIFVVALRFLLVPLLMAVPVVAWAAYPALSLGPSSGLPGSAVDLNVIFTPGSTPISTLMFDLPLPASLSYVSAGTGAAAAAAGKSAQGTPVQGGVRVLVFGMNQTQITAGVVAQVRVNISPSALPGTVGIGMGYISASDPNGVAALIGGTAGNLVVADPSAPAISAVACSAVSSSSAVISWTTNKAADSQVEYGISEAYGSSSTADKALVTLHSQTLTGLSAGTAYHFRIKSSDASGKTGISGDFSFTTAAVADTTPPVITAVAASAVSTTTATISWNTNEASDSQVEYGTAVSYGALSTTDPLMVIQHSRVLTGLTAGTTYHFRVRSRDGAGNPALSGDYVFVTAGKGDTTPPTISAVSATVNGTGAVIAWITNEPADSQVEYGTSSNYGLSTTLEATAVTSHSRTLSGLAVNSAIHYRVKSRDAAGNLAVSPDYTLTTGSSLSSIQETLYLPFIRLSSDGSDDSLEGKYTAVAVSNLDSAIATMRFTLYNTAGQEMLGDGIMNPVERTLRAGGQIPVIDFQLFGPAIHSKGSPGWVRVDSSTAKLAGFFLTFDGGLSFMDGADISSSLLRDYVLPEVGEQGGTRVTLANPNGTAATATIELVKADGTIRGSAQRFITAGASLSVDLHGELFPGSPVVPSDYVRVSADQGLVSYESWGKAGKDIGMLAGQDRGAGSMTLHSPQYVVGGTLRTTISIVNLDNFGGVVTLRLVGDNGSQIGTTRIANVAAGGKIFISDQAFFDSTVLTNPGQLRSGYVEVTGANVRLKGSVVFGDARGSSYITALPLVSTLRKSVAFSHIASNETSYTGVAMLNPNTAAVTVTLVLFDSAGKMTGSKMETVPAGQRRCRLLTEYFPGLVAKDGTPAYFKVSADREIACFALFGTYSQSVLSAIPAQPVP
jgi:hypothetical protein